MLIKLILPALIGVSVSTAAFAARDTMVEAIDVQIELPAVTNPAAAARFSRIDTDLENALTARLVDRLADKGVKITVDISEVELSNSFTEQMGLADTRLAATVMISDLNDNSNYNTYDLTVTINETTKFLPEGTDVATLKSDSEDYYKAMIAAFADAVVVRLDE